jgi:hypothetical protein
MGKRTSYEPGTFSWVELVTTDPAGAKEFYGGLLGWSFEDNPVPGDGVYTMCSVDGDAVAGVWEQPEQQRQAGVPPNWFNYVTVVSADETASRAAELGGAVHAEPFDVMEVGRMAVIADPTGAMFGIWEPRASIGAERVNEPGCLTWNDLTTLDPEAAQAFYSGLFGWRYEAMDTGGGPPYSVIRHEGAAGGSNGGVRAPGPDEQGVTPNWMPYFVVPSTDGAIEAATGAGGARIFGPIDLPGGRIAVLTDPQGAVFAVFEGETDG